MDSWKCAKISGEGSKVKVVVVYSSKTGNTEKICRAAAGSCQDYEIYSVREAPAAPVCDVLILGFWVDRGMPDREFQNFVAGLRDTKIILLGTLGAWPDSEHADECRKGAAALVGGNGNVLLGTFLCQGKVDPAVIEMMKKFAGDVHPMTEERKARLAEAEKHPDDNDCANVRSFVSGLLIKHFGSH